MRTLVLFDIDGTLLSSDSAGRAAITAAFAAEYDTLDFFDAVRFDGKTDRQIVRELHAAAGRPERATEPAMAELLARYVAHLEVELQARRDRIVVHPGMAEVIGRLECEADVCVGLLTGNIEPGARLKIGATDLGYERFRLGAFGSDSEHRPELPAIAVARARERFGRAPEGHGVVIIGDTPADVTCGQGIGARAVAVATGSYRVEELEAAGAHATFATFDDTDRVLEAILS